MAPCMGPLSPVCAYSLWAGLCLEKLVKLKKKKKKNYIVGFVRCCLGLDSNFKSLMLAFCVRFLAVIMWIKQKKNAP